MMLRFSELIYSIVLCRAWVDRVCEGDVKRWDGAAACIGNTSAVAARKAGLNKIYFPDSPGIDG